MRVGVETKFKLTRHEIIVVTNGLFFGQLRYKT